MKNYYFVWITYESAAVFFTDNKHFCFLAWCYILWGGAAITPQISTIERVNDYKPLIIVPKLSILDVCDIPGYTSSVIGTMIFLTATANTVNVSPQIIH